MTSAPQLDELPFALAGELAFGSFALERPLALFALLLPLVLLLLSTSKVRPLQRATGSLHLWRRLTETQLHSSASSRAQVPPVLWLFVLALTCASLAASQPRLRGTQAGRTWRIVVDRSPSMYLQVLPQREYADLVVLDQANRVDRELCPVSAPGVALRVEVALDAALAALEEIWRDGDRLLYLSPGREAVESTQLSAPRADWLAPDPWTSARPEFEALDAVGHLFVTDRVIPIERANLFASGGEAVTGLIGRRGNQQLFWTGAEDCEEVPVAARLAVAPADGLGAVADIFATWCLARGFELSREPSLAERSQAALVLSQASIDSAATSAVEVGRDGWALEVGLPSEERPSASALANSWLTSGGQTLVSWSPGQILVNWVTPSGVKHERPQGDPASFALSWSQLFDRAVLPEPRAVSLDERQAAGDSFFSLALNASAPESELNSTRFEFWLAIVAAAFAFLGVWRLGTN